MRPKPFSEIEFTHITLYTPKGSIKGMFSELRPDIATIPDGLIPYDIRHDDHDDATPVYIETFVAANYFGTVIVREPLDFGGGDYIEIFDWNFDDRV